MEIKAEQFDFKAFGQAIKKARTDKDLTREQLGGMLSSSVHVSVRVSVKDASVIVLDELTAALDPIAENELYLKYADLTEGKTSVYISHRLSSTRFCDRIIFIQDGKIAEYGSHSELMEKGGLYANMFNIQSHYYQDNVEGEFCNDEN